MSWVNDLAVGLGIPAGAATLAGTMYAACVAAEKAARPEALADIGQILKDPSWSRSARPSAIIQRVFVWTFGEQHLSWKCVRRSALASTLVFLPLGPVDKPDPETKASEQDEAEEAGCGLVIPGGNTPLFLEMTNEALDA